MKIEGLHTSIVGDAHAYTRSKTPWILDEHVSVYGKLIHYISGGGMQAFGRTVRQEEIRRRHVAFWTVAGVLAGLWVVFWVI